METMLPPVSRSSAIHFVRKLRAASSQDMTSPETTPQAEANRANKMTVAVAFMVFSRSAGCA